jgi:hydrogenase maturation protease
MSYWEELERPGPDTVMVGGVEVRRRSRVRLRPRATADLWDRALEDRVARVEAIVQDLEGNVQLAVSVEDDPGRDLGTRRRFFFSPAEVEPLGPAEAARLRVLVAGIGNVFLGDDGFGVALADRFARRELPPGVEVVDFGIRGMDLAYALPEYDAAILLDATPRGEAPGTLYVIEPDLEDIDVAPEAHGMNPVMVLALARTLGGVPPRTLVLGCEPQTTDESLGALTEPVRAALDGAERLLGELIEDLTEET